MLTSWPERTGLVRLLGRRFGWFVGAAAVVVLSLAYVLCAFAENAVAAGAADDVVQSIASNEPPAGPRTWITELIVQVVCSTLLVLSSVVVAALVHAMPFWEEPPEPGAGWGRLALYVARFFACVAALGLGFGVFGVTFCVVFFPGLVEGRVPEALLPWQAWFAVAAAGLMVRAIGVRSSRLDEFTTGLLREPPGPHPLALRLWRVAAALVAGTRAAVQAKSLAAFDPAASALMTTRCPTTIARGERYIEQLHAAIRFYDREGLATLDDPTSPEARFYTPGQRAAFADTYRRLKATLGTWEAWRARLKPASRAA